MNFIVLTGHKSDDKLLIRTSDLLAATDQSIEGRTKVILDKPFTPIYVEESVQEIHKLISESYEG